MATGTTKDVIEQAAARLQSQVPALRQLKLVVGLELRGRGDVQLYRVEMPGPVVAKDPAVDARVRVSIARSHFNELAAEGGPKQWREAYENGHLKATGPEQMLRLVGMVFARHEERARTSKTRH